MLKRIFDNIYHFFPVQLLLNYLKSNQMLLFFWVLLFGFINGGIAQKYGAKSLLLLPEYLNNSNYLAFFIYGVSFGVFTTAFHLASYIINGYKFPFLSTLYRPFIKFSINNSIIPLLFIINVVINSYIYQENYITNNKTDIYINLASFIFGFLLFFIFPFSYFFSTNKIFVKIYGKIDTNLGDKIITKPIKKALEKDKKWKERNTLKDHKSKWKVQSYFILPFRIRYSKDYIHFTDEYIQKILQQNHYNASVFSFVVLVILVILGFNVDNKFFVLPASASILLILSEFLFIYSVLHSLFKNWSLIIFLIIFYGINIMSENNLIGSEKIAYGLTYTKRNLNFEEYNIKNKVADYNNEISRLYKWKQKTGKEKPKIIFVNAGGGGLKMTLWTYYSLSILDSLSKGEITKQMRLFSGASGGMIGIAYFRELYRQSLNDTTIKFLSPEILKNLSSDILNPVLQSLSTKDWIFSIYPLSKHSNYKKDRAYEFENYLNKNTKGFLNRKLHFYKKYEENVDIPELIISPSILSTGQRILISPIDISYMVTPIYTGLTEEVNNNLEFRKLYKNFNADNLSFLSALRMNATYPYISPIVSLPGNPKYKIVDASYVDNYGLSTSLKYMNIFKSWIIENTSGIIFIQFNEQEDIRVEPNYSIFNDIVEPFTSSFNNVFDIQVYNNNNVVDVTKEAFGKNIQFINITLQRNKLPISLSWHLTSIEKEMVYESINSKENQKNITHLLELTK